MIKSESTTLKYNFDKKEKAEAIVFKLVQQERSAENVKFLKTKRISENSKIRQFALFYEDGLIRYS